MVTGGPGRRDGSQRCTGWSDRGQQLLHLLVQHGLGAGAVQHVHQLAARDDLVRRRAQRAFAFYPEEPPPDPAFEPIGDVVATERDADAIDLSKPALVARLRRVGLSGYAVDLSTDELTRVGLSVVRVVVPGLSPIPPTVGWVDHARLARAAG